MCSKKCIPKNFFGRPLQFGSLVVGGVMAVIMIICIIAMGVQVAYQDDCRLTPSNTCEFNARNSYGFSIVAVLYSFFMLFACLWFIWGVKKCKATVVFGWLVVAALWLIETFCLLLVLVFLYSKDANFVVWIITFLCSIVAICLLTYGLLVVLAYWYELKGNKSPAAA